MLQLIADSIDCVSVQKMSRMRSKVTLHRALYDFLDWLEKERPELIDTFWKAAFEEVTVERYPTLRKLHCSLMEGQFLHSARDGAHLLQD